MCKTHKSVNFELCIMRMKRYNSASAFRFKRWSRASYAPFSSVGRLVTIGKVAIGIEDASMTTATDEGQKEEINIKNLAQEYLLGYGLMDNMEGEGSAATLIY